MNKSENICRGSDNWSTHFDISHIYMESLKTILKDAYIFVCVEVCNVTAH